MAISRPRTSRHSRSLSEVKSLSRRRDSAALVVEGLGLPGVSPAPWIRAWPPIFAPGGSNPINASAIMVFPLPDSPTNPTDSPAPIRSDTSFTGRTQPAAVGNSTRSPRTSSNSFMEVILD